MKDEGKTIPRIQEKVEAQGDTYSVSRCYAIQ